MSVTIKDVAAAVGVSPSTVSRAFSRPEKVDQATRVRIMAAAERLDYRPNHAAQVLTTGRTNCLGVVIPDLENPFFAGILKGVEQAGEQHGYQVLLADTGEDITAEARAVEALSGRVDGLVMCSSRLDDDQLTTLGARIPVVLVNREVPSLPHVSFDNAGAVRTAVGHLHGLGHSRIGFVVAPSQSRSAQQRQAAFLDACAELGLHDHPVIGPHAPTFEGGMESADGVLAAGVTGVVVYNDIMAVGLLHQLLEFSVPVPERISVVGIDNIPLARMVHPGLTTVDHPRRTAGRRAVEKLHALVTGTAQPVDDVLTSHLVARSSTIALLP